VQLDSDLAYRSQYHSVRLVGPSTASAKKALSGYAVATFLKHYVNDITVLVDGAPQIISLTSHRYEDYIQALATHGFVQDNGALLCNKVFNIPQAQRDPRVEPHCVRNALGREVATAIASVSFHPGNRACSAILVTEPIGLWIAMQ
jgi:hypothetical protein